MCLVGFMAEIPIRVYCAKQEVKYNTLRKIKNIKSYPEEK